MERIFLVIAVGLTLVSNPPAASKQREAAKFDEFGNIQCDDEKARLDNFAIQLQNQPDAKGYIIFHGGRRDRYPYPNSSRSRLPRRGEAEARAARLKPYMINGWRGSDPGRIVVVNGGYRETWEAELWIVPSGVNPPAPTPTVKPQELRFRRGRVRKRDYHCYV
ncbi:MAG TPA: hypothetical protein DC047_12260 [Blastocatellia bacterium]|nr:hypothetical protein [Blastocatellia bacterium]